MTTLLWILYCIWHDVIVHPCCAVLWSTRMWWPMVGSLGDRLHMWSTGCWPFDTKDPA